MKRARAIKRLAASWWRRVRHPSLEDKNIRFLYLDTACMGLIGGGIGAFISVFLVRLGASSFLVSLLTSLPAIVMMLLSIPAGLYVERQRDLVRFTSVGRLVHRSFYLLVALLPFLLHHGLVEAIVVAYGLQAISTAFINVSWTGVIAEVVPVKRRPRVNGGRWALVSLVTAGVVAGFGYMLERMAFPINYQIVFVISFLGGMLNVYFFSRIRLPADRPAQAPSVQANTLAGRVRRYVNSFSETPAFLRYLFTTFVLRFGLNLPAALYSIYWVRYLNASDAWIGWRTTAANLALIVGYLIWGRIASRKGHHIVLIVCTIALGAYPVLTALTPSQAWLPLVALVGGFFTTGINITFFDTLLHVCPADKRPGFIALNAVFAQLAIFLAPMIGSLLSERFGIRAAFFAAGSIHLLAVLLFRRFRVADEEAAG